MVLPYDNVENAQQHLDGCVVLYDDKPYYIQEVYRSTGAPRQIVARMSSLPRMNDEITVPIFDPLFDAKGVGQRLGYINIGGKAGAVWTSRIPSRQYKQGLVRQNVFIARSADGQYRLDTLLRSPGLSDMLQNVYPTYDRALQMLKDDAELPSVAFHKHFKLIRQDLGYHLLEYRNERVAWGDPKEFKLPKQFEYLTQMLNKLGVNHVA